MTSLHHWVEKLNLQPHPEGGYYRETHRSKMEITVPGKIEKPHNVGSNIYYLLGNHSIGHFSSWHRLKDLEEIWHFHYGSELLIYIINEAGELEVQRLGKDEGADFQVHIPANCWFAAAVEHPDSNAYTLVSCTVYPAFSFEDFELGKKEELIAQFPQHTAVITKLCRN